MIRVVVIVGLMAAAAHADEPEIDIPSVGIPQLAVFPAPSADTPLPPPVVAAPLPRFGHWRIQRVQRGELLSGLIVGAAAYTLTAAIGLGTRDYWLCIPVAGPLVGTLLPPRGGPNPGEFGALAIVPGIIDLMLQGGFAPLFTMIGLWPKKVWQRER